MATSALATKAEQQSPQHQTPTKASPSSSSSNTIGTTNPQQSSPRNTASVLPPAGTYVSFGPVEVSKQLQDGEKFVKWDEVCSDFHFSFNLNAKVL